MELSSRRPASEVRVSPTCVLLVGSVLILSDDALLGNTVPSVPLLVARVLLYLVLASLALLGVIARLPAVKKVEGVALLLVGLTLLSAVVASDFTLGYVYQALVVLSAVELAARVSMREFLEAISTIMLVACAGALALQAVLLLYPGAVDVLPIVINIASARAVSIGVASVFLDTGLYRSSGFFREAGVFATFICVALINELLLRREVRVPRLFVLIAALATTFSTAGALCCALILLSSLTSSMNAQRIRLTPAVLLGALLVITAAGVSSGYKAQLFDKLSADNQSFGSTLSRVVSLQIGFEVARSNPIAGVGLTQYAASFKKESVRLTGLELSASGSSSATLPALAATYGVIMLGALLGLVWLAAGKVARALSARLLIVGTLVVMLVAQDLRYSVGLWAFLLMSIGSGVCPRRVAGRM